MPNSNLSIYIKISFCFFAFGTILGCGKISNVVELNFPQPATSTVPASPPFLGLLATSGTKTSGRFKIESSIGNQVVDGVKINGSFKFYGGIQGQVVSQ